MGERLNEVEQTVVKKVLRDILWDLRREMVWHKFVTLFGGGSKCTGICSRFLRKLNEYLYGEDDNIYIKASYWNIRQWWFNWFVYNPQRFGIEEIYLLSGKVIKIPRNVDGIIETFWFFGKFDYDSRIKLIKEILNNWDEDYYKNIGSI